MDAHAPIQIPRRALVISVNPSVVAMVMSAVFIVLLQLMFFYKIVAIIVATIGSMATGAYIHKIVETYRNIHYIFVQDKFDIMDEISIDGGERLRVDDIHIWSTTFKKVEETPEVQGRTGGGGGGGSGSGSEEQGGGGGSGRGSEEQGGGGEGEGQEIVTTTT
ncbi:hypothetical protein CCACVL1_19011 [Corchorus capsularis]|uniref:Uncharacterized protein n=1 Tax=Corchorus capsularis TaxID=210143 RepID=A0A1R3HJ02_COCAP|nr:hypothetical protein CCACVL1_19011 [Corchorus capsularis]